MAATTETVKGSNIRRRGGSAVAAPLYSRCEDVEDEQRKSIEKETPPEEAPVETPVEKSVDYNKKVEDIANRMFSSMIVGLDDDVIKKENLDKAIHNFCTNLNPTVSLARTQAYAESSKSTESTLRKLLNDAIHRSVNQQVSIFINTA